ncbi:hypothetical protein ARMGADRAFT_165184 [Armillaria gallica]|uniref:Uncharacterized protein n=1 Tax=Armillaria gallica TaxID=47427 RepID=A0A2H3DW99_ARMGA|nr:hypothetical protein ARMGADRAFT_165184 [Armillaria gallica]
MHILKTSLKFLARRLRPWLVSGASANGICSVASCGARHHTIILYCLFREWIKLFASMTLRIAVGIINAVLPLAQSATYGPQSLMVCI